MKNLLLVFSLMAFGAAFGQDTKEATMEKRAREFHRVIGSNDKNLWIKFIKDNFTQALIERPVKTKIETTDKASTASTSTSASTDRLEEKSRMFERLHNDFGKSKIVGIKVVNEMVDMIIENSSGMKGTFNLAFESKKPYQIDRVSVEIAQHRDQ